MDSQVVCSEVIAKSGIEFGSSGLRGLVKDFTPDVNASFAVAIISAIENEFSFDTAAIAIDNRPSSYAIAQACSEALKQHKLHVFYFGVVPTPHAVAHNEEYRKLVEGYMLRHKVKPGIAGWVQVNGWRGETYTLDKMEKRIEFDLEYIRNWSLFSDLKIVFLTIFKVFIIKNAY